MIKVVVDMRRLPGPRAVRVRGARGLRARRGRQAASLRTRARTTTSATRSRRPRTSARCRRSRSRTDPAWPQRVRWSSGPAWRACGRPRGCAAQATPARSSSSATSRTRRTTGRRCPRRRSPASYATTGRVPRAQGRGRDVELAARRARHAADLAARRVTLADGGTLAYDGLVAATGVTARRLPSRAAAAWRGGRHVVRTLDDAVALRAELGPGARVVVSAPASSAARSRRPRGSRLRGRRGGPRPVPMIRPLGPMLAAELQRRHEEHGVRFHLGAGVDAFDGDGARSPAVALATATGSPPTSSSRRWGRARTSGGSTGTGWTSRTACSATAPAPVSSDGRDPDGVAVVGDIARFPNLLFDEVPRRVEHWSVPTDTGRRAGAVACCPPVRRRRTGPRDGGDPMRRCCRRSGPTSTTCGCSRTACRGSPTPTAIAVLEGELDGRVCGRLPPGRPAGRRRRPRHAAAGQRLPGQGPVPRPRDATVPCVPARPDGSSASWWGARRVARSPSASCRSRGRRPRLAGALRRRHRGRADGDRGPDEAELTGADDHPGESSRKETMALRIATMGRPRRRPAERGSLVSGRRGRDRAARHPPENRQPPRNVPSATR